MLLAATKWVSAAVTGASAGVSALEEVEFV